MTQFDILAFPKSYIERHLIGYERLAHLAASKKPSEEERQKFIQGFILVADFMCDLLLQEDKRKGGMKQHSKLP